MKLSHLSDTQLSRLYNAGTAALFLGKAGVGKTQRLMQFAESMDLGLVIFHATSVDGPDVRGFAVPHKNPDGTAVTKFTLPPILEMIERTGKERGILFLDELLQGDHLVQKALGPVMSERMVGEHSLPKGWVVWGASNRTTDKAGVNRLLGHITNRLTLVHVESDIDGWLKWANDQGIHPLYAAFAKSRPGVVFDNDAPTNPDQPYCTPRSFANACRFHTLGGDNMNLPSDPVTQEFVAGFVGDGAAAEMFAFFKVVDELPTVEDILDNPEAAKVPPMERLDAQYAAAQMVVHHAKGDTVDALFTYIQRLNKELQTSTAKQLIEKSGGSLLNSPALTRWIAANRALITATLA